MIPGEVKTAAFQICVSGGGGSIVRNTQLPCNGPDIHSPLVQDFNFHTNLKKGS